MSLFIQQNDNRTKLQEKLAAELRERALQKAQIDDRPDGVEDTAYLKGTKKTTSLAWAWVVIIILAMIALIVIVLRALK